MMADIAHELRTPLAAIQGTVEALQDGVFPPTTENLATIHDEVTLLNRLVEDLRILAQAEAGQLTMNKTPVRLDELCQRQAAAFQFRAIAHEITLSMQIEDDLPPVWGDEQRLGQVIANLLDNALRHTPAGGVVCLSLAQQAAGVKITVRDDGEGVPVEAQPLIFDRLYRVDRSRARETGGSGLGLAIARQLIEAHGGRIWIHSPPPGRTRGSEFGFSLPAMRL
jgi:signal transduction histidine kinase